MSAEMRYTAFDPTIFLLNRLRQEEQAHFAATHGIRDQLLIRSDGSTPTVEEIQERIDTLRRLLDSKPWKRGTIPLDEPR